MVGQRKVPRSTGETKPQVTSALTCGSVVARGGVEPPSDVTLMSPVAFDTMMASLDIPDESPELAKLAKLARLIAP